jgi:hypothetical protein
MNYISHITLNFIESDNKPAKKGREKLLPKIADSFVEPRKMVLDLKYARRYIPKYQDEQLT